MFKNDGITLILLLLILFILSVTSVLYESNKKPLYAQPEIEEIE